LTLTNVAGKQDAAPDERRLVEAAKRDHAAFDQLYRRYVTRIYRYCYTHTNNARDAEDLTTQTFMAAMEGIGRFRGRGSFAAWLFGIAWRKCKDHHRQRYRITQEPLERAEQTPNPDAPDPERGAYHQDILDCVEQSWSLLSEDRQEVVRLRFWGGLNTAETAAVMGRSKGAVKMLLSRAIADLRERCLDE
jgi:RNA polymerase sigma-70 factor (ECF subfamily)